MKIDARLARWREELRTSLANCINEDENVIGILAEQDGRHCYASYGDYFLIESFMGDETGVRVW